MLCLCDICLSVTYITYLSLSFTQYWNAVESSCFMGRFNRRDTAVLSQTRYFPVRLYINALNGTIKIVDTVLWPHYPNKHVFSNCWNLLHNNSASFRCDGRLFHSPGPAAANALSLCHNACSAHCGTWSSLTDIGDKTAVVG